MNSKKEKWKVSSNVINGENKYRIFRLINANEPDHSGNREYASEYFDDIYEAERLAMRLNEMNL